MTLQIEDLTKEYKMGELTVPAISKITLKIDQGHFVAILGPSGSGKTTLLNLIGGIDRPSTGKIYYDRNGEKIELASLNEKNLTRYRRLNIGFIFQFYNLVASLTAFENVELAARLTNSSEESQNITKELLEEVGLEDKVSKFPAQLSGGEQQRVAIARALAKKPRILLADEPTGNLDTETAGKVLKLLQHINKKHKVTIILVTHNVGISTLADLVIYLRDGKVFGTSKYDHAKEKEFWEELSVAPPIDTV